MNSAFNVTAAARLWGGAQFLFLCVFLLLNRKKPPVHVSAHRGLFFVAAPPPASSLQVSLTVGMTAVGEATFWLRPPVHSF